MTGQRSVVYLVIASAPDTPNGLTESTGLEHDIMKVLGKFKMLGNMHDHNVQMNIVQVIQGA